MAITLHCPSCNSKLQVKETLAGKIRECPKCHSPITIPQKAVHETTQVPPAETVVPISAVPITEREYEGGVTFRSARCPDCNGQLQIPDDRTQLKCMYCGSDICVAQAIQKSGEAGVANYMHLARAADEAGNSEEAYLYYTKVLELEPQNVEAWLGKAFAAGWTSTLGTFRYSEVMAGVQKALQYAPEKSHPQIRANAADQINSLSTVIYNLSHEHFLKFVSLDNSWTEYLQRCELILQSLLFAHELDPDHRGIVTNIITLCKTNIEGIAYNDEFDNYMKKTWHVSDSYERRLRQVMDDFVGVMKQIDPAFQTPVIQKASTCFIVTATLGRADHPHCVVLRRFRDETLRHYWIGRRLVRAYNLIGPRLAGLIAGSELLRKLSYFFIVCPLVWLCGESAKRQPCPSKT